MRNIKKLFDLDGRVALVTGGAGHLGRAICETLAEQGANVVVSDRHGSSELAESLSSNYGIQAIGIDVDLLNEEDVRCLPRIVSAKMGGLDILVNNAAYVGTSSLSGWAVPFDEQSAETWRAAFEVNLTAVFILCQACTKLMAANGTGVIINIASLYGHLGPDWRLYEQTGMANPAAYSASKGGLLQLTRWLATTLAPSVRVNAVSPGGVERGQPSSFIENYEQKTPLRRMATEEDFKGVIAFLASDASAYITGQNIMVDGGWSAW